MTTFLPYHCPTFRTDHLLEPCTKNLARVKALKGAHKHVGPLEKCVECKGKMLVTKPRTVIEGLPAPENWVEREFVERNPEKAFKPYHQHQDWNPNPEVTTALHGIPSECADCSPLNPQHPFVSSADSLVSEDARQKLGKKEPKDEKILPELPKRAIVKPEEQRILEATRYPPLTPGKVERFPPLSAENEIIYHRIMRKTVEQQEEIVPAVKITEKEAVKMGIAPPPDDMKTRYCPTHPEAPQRIDKLGRWMGMCGECLSKRGKECGEQNYKRGVTAPPMAIPLNLPKYAELKAWLVEQADENERNLMQEIMFTLKKVWLESTGMKPMQLKEMSRKGGQL